MRWERKMLIRHVHRGTDPFSQESKEAKITRTERELLSKSPLLATSVKKLVMLARQIQGKTLEDALVQMRYSKKKMAAELKVQLELARDMAVVERGMGLGKVTGELLDEGQEIKIQTKSGKHLAISDPTRMYVAEAWVNRGAWRGRQLDYRARGRAYMKMRPATSQWSFRFPPLSPPRHAARTALKCCLSWRFLLLSLIAIMFPPATLSRFRFRTRGLLLTSDHLGISIVLKEEKTRIREHDDRVAKKYRQGPWVHLPDRPVSAQRPYYSW